MEDELKSSKIKLSSKIVGMPPQNLLDKLSDLISESHEQNDCIEYSSIDLK